MALNQLNPNSLFQPWQRAAVGDPVSRGSLISFNYPRSLSQERYQIHDPTPMVIITDVNKQAGYIRGVNLHYLSVPNVKDFLIKNARNPNFAYNTMVKPDLALANSFRMYYFGGMFNKRRLDTDFLLQLLNSVRSFSPSEIERVRNELRMQIQKRLQAKASELNAYAEWQNQQRQQQWPTQPPPPPTNNLQQPELNPMPMQPAAPAPTPAQPMNDVSPNR